MMFECCAWCLENQAQDCYAFVWNQVNGECKHYSASVYHAASTTVVNDTDDSYVGIVYRNANQVALGKNNKKKIH